MMLRSSIFISCILLVGCMPSSPNGGGHQQSSSVSPGVSSVAARSVARSSVASSGVIQKDDAKDAQAAGNGAYVTGVTDAQLGNGMNKVLFFHAGWCPYCKAHDASLQEWYAAGDVPISTYKVDYDSSLALRSLYGVLSQDTFVLVDGNGAKVRDISGYPSDDEVRALLDLP